MRFFGFSRWTPDAHPLTTLLLLSSGCFAADCSDSMRRTRACLPLNRLPRLFDTRLLINFSPCLALPEDANFHERTTGHFAPGASESARAKSGASRNTYPGLRE